VTLSARLAAQLAHPRGYAGRLLGRLMDLANKEPVQLAIRALAPKDGERILDAGCGSGAALAAVRQLANCELYGVDRSPPMIASARGLLAGDAKLFQGEIGELPPRWPSFDAVLALNVLYFADPEGVMCRALYRALRPGGRLVAYVTDRETMERWPFVRAGYHRLFNAGELESALIGSGFTPASISVKHCAIAPGIKGLIAHAER
jgi:SAM-dependent methyltransferase